MRPVKAPHDIVAACRRFAWILSDKTVALQLAGPRIDIGSACTPLIINQLGVMREIERLLAASDVEINLSRHDSFNLSLAEAMASAVPIITTDVVGIAEHITAAKAGLLIDNNRLQSTTTLDRFDQLLRSLSMLEARPSTRRQMGLNGYAYATAHLSLSAFRDRVLHLLTSSLSPHRLPQRTLGGFC
jgi:glycosyltransferase involved in cell wall biosynthesis